MQLSKNSLSALDSAILPRSNTFELPEKVLQFGTGVLLRGLAEYFIQKANDNHQFNGRVVVVKSTEGGDPSAFEKQDGLYTICIRGIENGVVVNTNMVCAAISRVISAGSHWASIMELMRNPEIKLIVSNTTEVGLRLELESIFQAPPHSFPAKLLALLYERYRYFKADAGVGFVIIPTELIPDNGALLKEYVIVLASHNQLEPEFLSWLDQANHFCSSLVDRIVPGKPQSPELENLERELGYQDSLLLIAEPYRLWAIEGNERVKEICSFAGADPGLIIAPDITPYRELKLRLLNGTHTLSCGLAFLSGFETVLEAMQDEKMSAYISNTMIQEILPALPSGIPMKEAHEFANKVLERFANPFIKHQWINITLQYSSKMKMRNVPILLNHYARHNSIPSRIATGFAAYLLFMKAVKFEKGAYFGLHEKGEYPIRDEEASYFMDVWHRLAPEHLVKTVLGNQSLWGTDLNLLTGFSGAVLQKLLLMMEKGVEIAT